MLTAENEILQARSQGKDSAYLTPDNFCAYYGNKVCVQCIGNIDYRCISQTRYDIAV